MIDLTQIGVGDVLAVRSTSLGGKLVQIGAIISGKTSPDANHVAVVHHRDPGGAWWGIEGRPGGVGWVDLLNYVDDRWTVSNFAQPKTDTQRLQVAQNVQQMLGDAYDWTGIAADACRDLGLPTWFTTDWRKGGVPGHVVCSSLAAYVYGAVGLARPTGGNLGRFVQPGDWADWIQHQGWQA